MWCIYDSFSHSAASSQSLFICLSACYQPFSSFIIRWLFFVSHVLLLNNVCATAVNVYKITPFIYTVCTQWAKWESLNWIITCVRVCTKNQMFKQELLAWGCRRQFRYTLRPTGPNKHTHRWCQFQFSLLFESYTFDNNMWYPNQFRR